jgi:hypothetical protein
VGKIRSLRKGIFNNKTEAKFLQAWLNCFEGEELSVDGSYGNKTADAVKRYQKKYNLQVDGKAGQQTLKHMGFRAAKDKRIVMLEIPFTKIAQANVLLENGKPYSCKKFADEGGFDIVWNGAFFNTKNRKIVQLLIQSGVIKQWGFGYKGIAFPNDWDKAFGTHYSQVSNKPYDLEGGAPVLIDNFKVDTESIKAFNQSIYKSKTKRNCTGITKNSIVLFFSISNCTLENMLNEGLYQRMWHMIGNDGGGSQSCFMGGFWVITTDGRSIPAAVGLKVISC